MITGSVAEGLCDEYSDCEMILYYDELPSEEELHLARQQNQGSEPLWSLGNLQDGSGAFAGALRLASQGLVGPARLRHEAPCQIQCSRVEDKRAMCQSPSSQTLL